MNKSELKEMLFYHLKSLRQQGFKSKNGMILYHDLVEHGLAKIYTKETLIFGGDNNYNTVQESYAFCVRDCLRGKSLNKLHGDPKAFLIQEGVNKLSKSDKDFCVSLEKKLFKINMKLINYSDCKSFYQSVEIAYTLKLLKKLTQIRVRVLPLPVISLAAVLFFSSLWFSEPLGKKEILSTDEIQKRMRDY